VIPEKELDQSLKVQKVEAKLKPDPVSIQKEHQHFQDSRTCGSTEEFSCSSLKDAGVKAAVIACDPKGLNQRVDADVAGWTVMLLLLAVSIIGQFKSSDYLLDTEVQLGAGKVVSRWSQRALGGEIVEQLMSANTIQHQVEESVYKIGLDISYCSQLSQVGESKNIASLKTAQEVDASRGSITSMLVLEHSCEFEINGDLQKLSWVGEGFQFLQEFVARCFKALEADNRNQLQFSHLEQIYQQSYWLDGSSRIQRAGYEGPCCVQWQKVQFKHGNHSWESKATHQYHHLERSVGKSPHSCLLIEVQHWLLVVMERTIPFDVGKKIQSGQSMYQCSDHGMGPINTGLDLWYIKENERDKISVSWFAEHKSIVSCWQRKLKFSCRKFIRKLIHHCDQYLVKDWNISLKWEILLSSQSVSRVVVIWISLSGLVSMVFSNGEQKGSASNWIYSSG
jgi:hypothetical protein